MPTELTLPAIQRGDTTPFTFNFAEGETVLDMRGKTLVMSFKLGANLDDADASLVKTVLHPLGASNDDKGRISFNIERSESALLIPGADYYFYVRIVVPGSPEDIETTYFNGVVPVEES